MLMDIWASIGEFVCENYETGLIFGLALLIVMLCSQIIVNGSLEEDIMDLVERVEALENNATEEADETEKMEEE